MDIPRLKRRVIRTIDEVQGLLAKLVVKRHMDKSKKVLEAEVRGRRVAESLGRMIERESNDRLS